MKIVFFGSPLTSSRSDHRSRILFTLLEGTAEKGHHVVYFEPAGGDADGDFSFVRFVRYGTWEEARDTVETECSDASAIVVLSGFPEGPDAAEFLLEQAVPAAAFYDLDPWDTLNGFDGHGAAPWLRADQIGRFDIVFSISGGPALDTYRTRWSAEEAQTLYEAIDTAVFHPRSPEPDIACDLALVADRHPSTEATLESYLLEAARALPSHRFIVAGSGWEAADSWPENIELLIASSPVDRATIYSSARLVLVPVAQDAIDYALPLELLEPAACGAACAVVDRPGLSDMFVRDEEILVPASGADLVPYLTVVGDSRLLRLGNMAEKRALNDYCKLRIATKFEQRIARKFFRGHNG
ncbi:MAG TPA: hypothetical protein PLF26_03535 [Blastocatellia bacterium]|nr:hypothetical protein [Blastocatellia bacterium]